VNTAYLRERLPTAAVLLDLEPEEFGAIILEAIRRGRDTRVSAGQIPAVFFPVGETLEGFPRASRAEIEKALIEAWAWLEVQGLLVWADFANGPNGYRSLSRRAMTINPEDFSDFAAARSLPRDVLHESIRDRVWSDFVRGHYDSAVLYAARQVEIAVRNACEFGNERYGVQLMRDAFHSERGPLTDLAALVPEREARAALFVGLIGSYKNPLSHQDLDMDDPHEAIEMIILSSHLLRIVSSRVAINAAAERE
jgi:uncharacterized protein (TIGR02391 family)